MSNYAQIMMQAVDRAADVMEKAMTAIGAEKPSREEIKERLQGIMDAPDLETMGQLRALFDQDFPGEFVKEQGRIANAARR